MKKLAIDGGQKTVKTTEPHYVWPKITTEMENTVVKQLHQDVSLYKKTGIFQEFEDSYAAYHNKKHALLFNSGTSALHACFEALDLSPEDEVICPVYTFFATISPVSQFGSKVVFVDCDLSGNIDPDKIESAINKKTKAIVITHMWGIPCEMDKIKKICKDKEIALIEDCSHAHGATFKNRVCGSFGDMSAWSLQGQKIITGGEGGVFTTDNNDFFYRALLLGHYNKRCKDEIPDDSDLKKYAHTGFGLKLRAHPIAIAMANEMFRNIDNILSTKRLYAKELSQLLSKYEFVHLPSTNDRNPSWYAFVFQIDEKKLKNWDIQKIYDALKAEGLDELDIPKSTGLLNDLPLFSEKRIFKKFPHSTFQFDKKEYPIASWFYNNSLKLPVWGYAEDRNIFDQYKVALEKVLDCVN